MDVGERPRRVGLLSPTPTPVILLDTNALIWLQAGAARARPLEPFAGRVHVSPAVLLELGFLAETGRLKLRRGVSLASIAEDDRWIVDDPPALAWFALAAELKWTRDPFDRLIAAHARLRRWRLATADAHVLQHLDASEVLEL